jgi:hypothetical protein
LVSSGKGLPVLTTKPLARVLVARRGAHRHIRKRRRGQGLGLFYWTHRIFFVFFLPAFFVFLVVKSLNHKTKDTKVFFVPSF